jgi:internalin A
LKGFAGLENLHTLNLGGTQVTDAGIKELPGLSNLDSLEIGSRQVTEAALARLEKALPKCDIAKQGSPCRR